MKSDQWIGVTPVKLLLVTFAYALAGKLALLLAIPPGYATAIFPPAGIAVTALLLWGYRLWPGVFFGSLLLNVWVGLEQGPLNATGLTIAAVVALGATVQALAACWLVRKAVGFPNALSKERDILKFMLSAGPIPCLINASFGAAALFYAGVISSAEVGYSWFTWWVGDSIGVLITAPLMLTLFAEPKKLWHGRRTVLALPLLLAMAAVIALFYVASHLEQQQYESNFRGIATDAHEKIRTSIKTSTDSVVFIERFITSSSQINREEFRYFVDYALRENPGIQGLSWNLVVPDSERQAFEREVQQEGFADFQIMERNAQQQLVPASTRPFYVVVKYVEPLAANNKVMGFDAASNATRLATMQQARDSGIAVATSPVHLVQNEQKNVGFLLFQPVYLGQATNVAERRQALVGYAVGIFGVAAHLDKVLSEKYQEDLQIQILDITDDQPALLYGSKPEQEALMESLQIGGRHWQVSYWPTLVYQAKHRGWQAWTVLAVGLLFTSLMGAFLLSMSGRTFHIASVVERKTAELRGILMTAIEAIIILDAKGQIESLNPAGEALFGYPEQAIKGKSVTLLIPDFFTLAAQVQAGTSHSFAAGHRGDSVVVKKDLTRVPVELAVSAVQLADRLLYTVIVHDLTERQKVSRMKDEFVAVVSHELRTPLTSIMGSLGLIRGGALQQSPEQIQQMIAVAHDNSERLARLVNDLLTFNKATLADSPLHLVQVSLNGLLEQALQANQGYASQYGVSFDWHPGQDLQMTVDPDKIMQVMSNLLSNAAKYSPQGGAVQIRSQQQGNKVRIEVEDSGPGIPLEFQDRVFEKFAQADSSNTRRVGGTGLGMAISKSLVELHGGSISFVSVPGKGTTFAFELPLLPVTPQDLN